MRDDGRPYQLPPTLLPIGHLGVTVHIGINAIENLELLMPFKLSVDL